MRAGVRALLLHGGLAALAATLVSLVFVIPSQSPDGDQLLARPDLYPLRSVTLSREGRTVQVSREPEDEPRTFWQRDGARRLGEMATIDALTRALQEPSIVRSVLETDRERLGLVRPRGTLRLEQPSHVLSITLGALAPTPAGARYAEIRVNTEKPKFVVLSPDLSQALDRDPQDLLDSRIVHCVPSDLEQVSVETAKHRAELVRDPKTGKWYLDGTPRRRADRSRVEPLVLALTTLRASRFLSEPGKGEAMGESPLARVKVTTRKTEDEPLGTKSELRLGGSCPGKPEESLLTMDAPPTAACVPRAHLAPFELDGQSFADDHLFAMNMDEVESLTVGSEAGGSCLARQGTAFIERSPNRRDVSLQAGNALLETLVRLQGKRISEDCPPPSGAHPGWKRLALRSAAMGEADVVDEVVFISPLRGDGSRLVCRTDDQQLLLVGPPGAGQLDIDFELLQEAPEPSQQVRENPSSGSDRRGD